MLLHWYTCISMITYCYIIYHISSETDWWVLSNASLIMQIRPVFHKILANEYFTVTDDLISQLFVVAFVHPIYVQIALILGFTVQLSLWKLVYLLWRYKLNEVCDIWTITLLYIYFCVWGLDLRLNNINLYQLFLLILLIIYYHYFLILNL